MFDQLSGFKALRRVPNRLDMIFVDFATIEDSGKSKQQLHGMQLTEGKRAIEVEYDKK